MKHPIWPLLVLLIFVRYFTSRPVFEDGDKIRISTTVFSDPVIYTNYQYLKIAGLKASPPLIPEISYGDKIVIEGIVSKGELKDPKIVFLGQGGPLSKLRQKIIAFYNSNLPQPKSGLLAGIVLGAKGTLDREFYDQTKAVGVAHVVVASGASVTFVISFLIGILSVYLPRKRSIPFVIFGIVLYLFISGFDAPLIRAAIMSSALLLGQELGRVVSAWRIFFLTAGLMLVYNPEWAKDIGFLLSFASTAALMLFEKKIEGKFLKLPELLRKDLSTSLAAQIGVTPVLLFAFGRFSVLSPIANAMTLWTIPPLMIIGSVGGMVGLLFPELGKLVLWLGYPMLWWFVKIVEIFN